MGFPECHRRNSGQNHAALIGHGQTVAGRVTEQFRSFPIGDVHRAAVNDQRTAVVNFPLDVERTGHNQFRIGPDINRAGLVRPVNRKRTVNLRL